MSSKVTNALILECIKEMREGSKKRAFLQTVEMQIGLKDYDPQRDKRFTGTVKLQNIPRPNMKICLIADQKHADEAKDNELDIDVVSLDFLKKFNKDKKVIKKWAKKYYLLLATDALVKKVPQVLGPVLNRIGMFPQPCSHSEPLQNKLDNVRGSIKWQLKKVTCLNVAIGNEEMTDEQLRSNIAMGLNFLASLLKRGWHNLKTVTIKTTMGKPIKLL